MITIERISSENKDFLFLVEKLNADLAIRNGEDHGFYMQFNGLSDIKHALVAYLDGTPIGCGAMKEYENGVFEVKRMFVISEGRGKGIATAIVKELENWGTELQLNALVLETGLMLPEAIALYKKLGFDQIENYGQYIGNEDSVCFRKELKITQNEN